MTVISRSEAKNEFATKCGCDKFVSAASAEQMGAASKTLDRILNTIPARHDFGAFLPLLDIDGTQVLFGIDPTPVPSSPLGMIFSRSGIHDSVIGGIRNTQEVIDLCAKAEIMMDTELVRASQVNSVMEKLDSGNDSGLRYVIDIKTLTEDCGTTPAPKFKAAPSPARQTGCIAGLKVCFGMSKISLILPSSPYAFHDSGGRTSLASELLS